MIYCPKCGTANLEDRNFCVQCGAALEPEKGQRCPMCGAINPPGNVFCDECHARLVPVIARPTGPLQMPPSLKGLSLPTKPLEEIEEGVPPKKPEFPEAAPLPEAEMPIAAPAPGLGEAGQEEEEPAWLVNLRARYGRARMEIAKEEAVEEKPAWLRELHEAPAAEEAPDWLGELRRRTAEEMPAPEEVEGVPPPAEEEAIPSWLTELRAGEEGKEEIEEVPPLAEAEELPTEAAVEEMPEWLRGLREETLAPAAEAVLPEAPPPAEVEEKAEEEVTPIAIQPTEEEGLPDWLRELTAEGEEVEETPPLAIPPTEEAEPPGKLPDWLQRITLPEEAPPAEGPPPVEAGVPEWLRMITPAAETPPPVKTEKGAPAWLQEISETGEIPVFKETIPPEETEERVPSWLQELAPAIEEEAIPPEEVPAIGEEELKAGVPTWLEEIKAMEPVPFEEPVALAEGPAPSEEVVEEQPEEVPPFPVGVEELIEEVPAPLVSEELAEAVIPDWVLALRPPELETGPAPTRERVTERMETTGLLAGIPGILPAEPIIGVPHTLRPPAMVTVPGELALEAKLLGEVIARERPPAVSIPRERGKRLARQLGRVLLYLVLLVAILIPYFFSTGLFDESVPPTPETEDFFRTIENITPGSVVLVAFDYDPSLAGEMTPQAEALIQHLMRRGLKVMTISLYPGGQALAEEILRGAAVLYEYQAGQDYINLGYLPNHPASLRAFTEANPIAGYTYEGTSVTETPLGQRINSLNDFGLVVELAAGRETLRWWVEQVGSQYPDLPMIAGISASADPYVRPYYETPGRRQLKGLLVGLPGAAQYEGLTGRVGHALDNLESQGLAHLTIVAVIVVGNLVYLVSRLQRGK